MRRTLNQELLSLNLFKILKSFSKKEISEFEKFVSSPIFNTQNTLIRLIKEIRKFHPVFKGEVFSKQNLFESVNPGKKYDDVIFRKYVSNLMKLAEEYLIYIENSLHEDRRKLYLLDQLDKRNLIGIYEKQMIQSRKTEANSGLISNESFYNKHFREELNSIHHIRKNDLHLMAPSLIKSHFYMCMHVLLTSTVYNNMMLVHRKNFKDSEENKFFERFFDKFDIVNYLGSTENIEKEERWFIELCKYDFLLSKDPFDTNNLKKMNEYLYKMSAHFNKNLLYTFYSHINKYYLLNINSGKNNMSRELFENYKAMLDKDLYIDEDREYINFSEYKTILHSAFRLKEFEWAKNFIEKYKYYHDPADQKNIINYSMAFLKFETGNYEESLKLLSETDVKNVIMQLDLYVLHMLVYYEMDFVDSALSVVDSFRHFIKDNTILSDDVVEQYTNFIKYYRQIIRLKEKNTNGNSIFNIKSDLINNNNFVRRNWLLEKLEGIKN